MTTQKHTWTMMGLLTLLFFLTACAPSSPQSAASAISTSSTSPLEAEIKTLSDGTRYIVHPDDIQSGGPPMGGIGLDRGIPALAEKNIHFVSVAEADEWIEDNELVLALQYRDVTRVYPLQILVWHEIVNDIVAGEPLLITYCPLCGSAIAYKAVIEVDGEQKATRFGTSGKLYQSNLVMYDEETETYWQQIDGKAIYGPLTGQELEEISIDTVVWRDWKKSYPQSEILSQNTGISRNYGKDPYGSYYEDSYLLFPVKNEDKQIHPKTIVFGIEVNGMFKAYREEDLIKQPKITDIVHDIPLIIERSESGIVIITNSQTGEEIVKEREMWFAWYAFHPDTKLFGKE